MKKLPFAVVSSKFQKAVKLKEKLCKKFSFDNNADIMIVLGGDGFMLRCLHKYKNKIFYGIHCGTLGFLMNVLKDIDLLEEQVMESKIENLNPLIGTVKTIHNKKHHFYAINEVSLLRSTPLAADFDIYVNENLRLKNCISDGIVVSTAAGSTAYNRSLGGPIFPIDSPLIALTPNNVFSPFGWKGALLRSDSKIKIEILNPSKRKVCATFDFLMVNDVLEINIMQDFANPAKVLFHQDDHLRERIICTQFANKSYTVNS